MERLVKVEKVLRDDRNRAIWVRLQYFKDGDLLHDVVFMLGKNHSMFVLEKRKDNYIPPNRFKRMCDKAAAIIFDKQVKEPEQPAPPL